jgi:hypothetical protein
MLFLQANVGDDLRREGRESGFPGVKSIAVLGDSRKRPDLYHSVSGTRSQY